MRRDSRHGARQHGGMDLPIPDFGDAVGRRRLYRAAVERIRQMDIPESQKRAWIGELTRQYRAARAAAWDGLPQLDLDPIRL